jgi:hypothetical protein
MKELRMSEEIWLHNLERLGKGVKIYRYAHRAPRQQCPECTLMNRWGRAVAEASWCVYEMNIM